MKKLLELIVKLTDYISYSGKTKRELPEFIMRYEYYMNLPEMEFTLEYFNLCNRLKRAELMLSIFFATILVTVFISVSEFMVNLIIITFQGKNSILSNSNESKAIGILFITLLIIISIVVVIILLGKVKNILYLRKEKMLMEKVSEVKNKSK